MASKVVDQAAVDTTMNMPLLPRPTSYAWLAGPIVGGLAAIALVAGAVWFLVDRQRQRTQVDACYVDGRGESICRNKTGDKALQHHTLTSLCLVLVQPFELSKHPGTTRR